MKRFSCLASCGALLAFAFATVSAIDLAANAQEKPLVRITTARAVLSSRPDAAARLVALAGRHNVPLVEAGVVGEPGGALSIRVDGTSLAWTIRDLREIYYEAIPRRMRQDAGSTMEA